MKRKYLNQTDREEFNKYMEMGFNNHADEIQINRFKLRELKNNNTLNNLINTNQDKEIYKTQTHLNRLTWACILLMLPSFIYSLTLLIWKP